MADLLRTRCAQGQIVITDEYIYLLFDVSEQSALYRPWITDIESKGVTFFGRVRGVNLTFHGQGRNAIYADLVYPDAAQQIMELLQPKETDTLVEYLLTESTRNQAKSR